MPLTLSTPEVTQKTIVAYKVIQFLNNTERGVIVVDYVGVYDDGSMTIVKKHRVKGVENIKAVYAEMDKKIAEGLSFEEASKAVLYSMIPVEGVVS